MNWKFWEVFSNDSERENRLAGPTTIPEPVARYMVVELKEEAEWVWRLKAVLSQRPGSKHEFFFRVYEESKVAAQGIRIQNYSSLDAHKSLIILEGSFNRKRGDVREDRQEDFSLKAA